MPSPTLSVVVPLSYIRPDTLLPRHRILGYAVINDAAAVAGEIETILDDEYLEHKVWHNLTLGFFTGQGHGAPHVSRLRYDLAFRGGSDTLAECLDKWCTAQGVDNEHRPSTAQLVSLINHLRLPLRFGRAVLRDLLTRVLGRIFKPKPGQACKSTVKRVGVTSTINALFDHFATTSAFQKALPKSTAAALDPTTPPATPLAAGTARLPTPARVFTRTPAPVVTGTSAPDAIRTPASVVTATPAVPRAAQSTLSSSPAATPASAPMTPGTTQSRPRATVTPIRGTPLGNANVCSPVNTTSSSSPVDNRCNSAIRDEYLRRIIDSSLNRFEDIENDIHAQTGRAEKHESYFINMAKGMMDLRQTLKERD